MKRSFTLIEVLMSVLILATFGLGLIEMSNKHVDVFEFIDDKFESTAILSVASSEGKKDFNKMEKELLPMIRTTFKIDNDVIKERLDNVKFTYFHDEISMVELEEDEEEQDERADEEDVQQREKDTIILGLYIDRNIVKYKKSSNSIYRFSVR